MEPDTTIIARPTPAPVWLQPTVTEQLAGATAQAAQRTVDESHPAVAALAEPAGPANLNRLGDRIAELSARIDAAIYELLCYLREFDRQHGWEGFREPTIAQRRADALGLVAESTLAGGLDPGNPGDRFQVTVHVPADTLASHEPASTTPHPSAETCAASPAASQPGAAAAPTSREMAAGASETGAAAAPAGRETAAGGTSETATAAPHLSAETSEASAGACECAPPPADLDAGQAVIDQAGGLHLGREAARRLACDAALVALLHGADGELLDVGRRSRAVPTALRRALLDRDRSQCQFPGCTSRRCDAHHVVHWADGGETKLANLASLCRFHHRAVHEEGFRVVADAAGQFRFLRPDGVALSAEPPAVCWEGAPLAPTDARLAAAGVSIGPHTATPDWYGESLDLAAALDVLWQPPAREAPAAVARGAP